MRTGAQAAAARDFLDDAVSAAARRMCAAAAAQAPRNAHAGAYPARDAPAGEAAGAMRGSGAAGATRSSGAAGRPDGAAGDGDAGGDVRAQGLQGLHARGTAAPEPDGDGLNQQGMSDADLLAATAASLAAMAERLAARAHSERTERKACSEGGAGGAADGRAGAAGGGGELPPGARLGLVFSALVAALRALAASGSCGGEPPARADPDGADDAGAGPPADIEADDWGEASDDGGFQAAEAPSASAANGAAPGAEAGSERSGRQDVGCAGVRAEPEGGEPAGRLAGAHGPLAAQERCLQAMPAPLPSLDPASESI
jgi:hypothetical protein